MIEKRRRRHILSDGKLLILGEARKATCGPHA